MSTRQILSSGDEIRIIAPSASQRPRRERPYARAKERLESLGFTLSYGAHIQEVRHILTADAKSRAEDFNNAYADPRVKAVMAMHGGWSSNDILELIDWGIVKANPKPFIGYSDITVLLNAIHAKADNVNYLGPDYVGLGAMRSWEYTLEYFAKALRGERVERLTKSRVWGVGRQRKSHRTLPWQVLQSGKAEAVLLGGNIGTLYLPQGTEYMPRLDRPYILALEDDDQSGEYTLHEFSRRLESILQLPGARGNLRGLLIGRFMPQSKVRTSELRSVIASKNLTGIPIVSGIDFGHTWPMVTLPIGGMVAVRATDDELVISI